MGGWDGDARVKRAEVRDQGQGAGTQNDLG